MQLKSADTPRVKIKLDAFCHDCKHRHLIDVPPDQFGHAAFEWQTKHAGHNFEFLSTDRTIPKHFDDSVFMKAGEAPWWLDYKHNADLKIAYAASAAITISPASLASSSTFVAGRESTAISNTTNKYIDYRVAGYITTGTTPTVDKEIRIYAYAGHDDTPTYPDVLDGTDSAETISNAYILSQLPLLGSSSNSATSDVAYHFTKLQTIAEAFGFCPKNWGIYVAHSTVAALNATAGNHVISQTGIYFTSV